MTRYVVFHTHGEGLVWHGRQYAGRAGVADGGGWVRRAARIYTRLRMRGLCPCRLGMVWLCEQVCTAIYQGRWYE